MATGERVDAWAGALLAIVGAEGHAAEVADELFRFTHTVDGDDRLRSALSDASLPVERRVALVEDLLSERALTITTAIVSFVVAAGRAHDLPAIVDRFRERAAEEREHAVAEVRSAVALDDETKRRLAEALGQATGKRVEVTVVVDERVLGGIVARIGDTVIDGTIRHRLDSLREQT
jgi:F-type H+-transporting ATPase subunit delta